MSVLILLALSLEVGADELKLPPSTIQDLPKVVYHRNPLTYSEGFQLGFITDYHRDGFFVWSYEGELMVGYGSSRKEIYDQDCLQRWEEIIAATKSEKSRDRAQKAKERECFIFNNPTKFSSLFDTYFEQYKSLGDLNFTPVLIYYRIPLWSPKHLITRTYSFIYGIYPVNASIDLPKKIELKESEMPIGLNINVRKGIIDGRVVQASLDHYFRKSFEITIQQGPLGSIFKRMSVSDQGIFDYITHAMLSGKMVRLEYVELTGLQNNIVRIGKDYDTPFRIISVEVRDEADTKELGAPTK